MVTLEKSPRDLSAMECASLVGCIKNPTRISPLNNVKENKKARDQVLQRMVDEGFISSKEGKIYRNTPVVVRPNPIRRGTSHLYERVANAVRSRLGEDALTEGGFKIYTTIDLDVQQAMEKSLLRQLSIAESHELYEQPLYDSYRKRDGKPNYLQAAGYMIDNESGSVLAYIGGRDFTHSQYDFVESGSKPSGTAFFPFIYTAALENGMSPVTRLIDRPMDNRAVMVDGREGILGEWGMETLQPKYEGDISMRRAMEVSKIAASVRLGKEVGLARVMQTARKFGLSLPETKLLARMLVGADDVSLPEMVNAYATFARAGYAPKPAYFIDRVVGPKGIIRYKAIDTGSDGDKRVISRKTAYIINSMLQSSLTEGTGKSGIAELASDASLAGKTGTTYDFADNWFHRIQQPCYLRLVDGFCAWLEKSYLHGSIQQGDIITCLGEGDECSLTRFFRSRNDSAQLSIARRSLLCHRFASDTLLPEIPTECAYWCRVVSINNGRGAFHR